MARIRFLIKTPLRLTTRLKAPAKKAMTLFLVRALFLARVQFLVRVQFQEATLFQATTPLQAETIRSLGMTLFPVKAQFRGVIQSLRVKTVLLAVKTLSLVMTRRPEAMTPYQVKTLLLVATTQLANAQKVTNLALMGRLVY
jgi:hypothetical protein